MPVIAICSPESSKRWACQADLCLPETITPAALIAVLRMLLRVQAVERGYLRVQSAATADFGSGVDRPASHSQIRLDELEREKDLLIQQNRHLCEFITSITHEIRSSLCSVIVVSSWILGEYSEQMDASGREYLGLLKESVERMCKVVERAGQQVGMLKPG